MSPADLIFDLVIDKGDLNCVMCYSYQTNRKINIYRYEVDRVLRLGDLEDESGDSDNKEGVEGKGGTATTPSTLISSPRALRC